jgi:hypothetical protein
MRAEDHHPRKSDGNNHNCGHAARSRSLITCERPPRSACGPGLDVISAGWLLAASPDVGDEIFRGWFLAVVRRFSTPGTRFQKRIRIVDSCGDVFSDPGANPGASIYQFAAGPHPRGLPALRFARAADSLRLSAFRASGGPLSMAHVPSPISHPPAKLAARLRR